MSTLITSMTKVNANAQMPFLETFDQRGAFTSNSAVGANIVYLMRLRVAAPITVSTLTIFVATAAGNIDLGFYSSSDGGTNFSRLTHTGPTAVAGSSANQSIALLTSITLVPFTDYWWALGSDGAPTIGRATVNAAMAAVNSQTVNKGAAYSSGLPTTIASPSGTTLLPWIHGA